MRKSFTRFLGLLMLFCMMSLFSVAQTLVPADGSPAAANVDNRSGSVTLTMTFTENMVPASGVGIIALSTGGGVQVDPIQITGATSTNLVTGSTATIVDKVVTLHFVGTYTEGAVYEITATSDALKSVTNVPWAGISFGNWTITIADYTAPALITTVAPAGPPVRLTPADEATAVVLGNDLNAVFTEYINFGTGNIGLYTQAGDVVEIFELATDAGDFDNAPAAGKVSIDLNKSLDLDGDGSAILDGGKDQRTLYINPTNPLSELQKYYVRIAPTAIVDLAAVPAINKTANAFAGINNNTTWNFWAQDVTAPTANLTAGIAGTHLDVAKLEKPTLTFVDNAQLGLYPSTLVLKKAGGGTLALNEDITAKFQINGGAYATFTATYKGNNVVEFATTNAAGWGSLTPYTISYVSGFQDNQGNVNNLATTYTFTTGDFVAPVLAPVRVEASGTGAAPNTNSPTSRQESTALFLNVTATDAGTPTYPVTVKYLVVPNGTAVVVADVVANGTVLPLADATVSTQVHQAWITADYTGTTFASNTLYDVHFIATDNATTPNTSTALTSATIRTNDILAPTAVVTTVAEGGAPALTIAAGGSVANVDKDGVITMTFNEAIIVDASGITVEWNSTGTTWAVLAAGGTDYTYALDGTQKIVTITPAHRDLFGNGWKSLSNYRVKIVASKVHDDLTVGPKTGTTNYIAAATYTFSTEDFEGPIPTFKSSGNTTTALHGRTNVAKNDNIVITFSEAPRNESGALLTNANIKNYVQVRKGDGASVNIASTDLNPNVTMTISGNVVTIDPADPFASETYYGVWVSTLIEDDDGTTGTKLNMYQDNTTPIAGTSEFATFKAVDSAAPLVTFNTRNAANGAFTTLVNVPVDAMPYIFLSEDVVTTIGGGTIVGDDNQIRSLIEIREGSSTGTLINFNVFDFTLLPNTGGVAYEATDAGTSIVINPIDFPAAYNFTSGGTYYIGVSGLQDAAGNPVTASTTFTVVNTDVLTYTMAPAKAAVQVDLAGNIVLTFDRNVNKTAAPQWLALDIDGFTNTDGTTPLDLTNAAHTADVKIDISTTNAAVTVAGNVVTIPYAGLTANTVYKVFMMAGAFTAANNSAPSAIINAASAYTFTSKDSQGPRIDLTNGAAMATPMGALATDITGAKLRLDFDERVYIGTGVINIKKAEGGVATTVAAIDMQSANIVPNPTGSDNTKIDVLIPVTLEYSTSYYVEIPATAFKDVYNNPWEWLDAATPTPSAADDTYGNRAVTVGTVANPYVLGASVWDFSTIADPVPTYVLASCNPAAVANDVPLTTGITIAFSEPMTLNTTGVHNLSIQNSTNPASDQSIDLSTTSMTWAADNKSVTIAGSLINDLTYGRNYWINIDAGAFLSATNQSIAALTSAVATNWFFTTTDATLPAIESVSYSIANDGTQVDKTANIIITFTEPITLDAAGGANWANTVTLTPAVATPLVHADFSLSSDGLTLTINPQVSLATSQLYTINLLAGGAGIGIVDAVGNENIADGTNVFTTEDETAPAITVNAGVQAYSSSAIKASITVTDFTTVAGAGPNDITVYYLLTANGAYSSAPGLSTMLAAPSYDIETGVNKQLEITGLAEKTQYDIWFMAVDKSNNANKTVVTKVDEISGGCFKLATTDVTAPAIDLLTPLTGTENINFNAHSVTNVTLKIRFNEQVQVAAAPALEAQIVVRKKSDNTLVYTFDKDGAGGAVVSNAAFILGSSDGTLVDNQISCVIPGTSLASSTEYYVEIANGLASDIYNVTTINASVANNATNEVYIGNSHWTFKTADEVAPALITNINPLTPPVQLTPADGATGVAVAASGNPLVMVFNEDIQKNITDASWIRIYQVGAATPFEVIPVSGSDVVVSPDKRTVTITRHNTYPSEVGMYINIDNNAFFDFAPVPNYYAGIANTTDWNFTSKDVSVPRTDFLFDNGATLISSVTTVNSLVDINSGVKIQFVDLSATPGGPETLLMNGGAVPATVTSYVNVVNASGTTVTNTSTYAAGVITVNITGGYLSNQTYTITLTGGTGTTGLTDDAGNFIGTSSITFNTEDRTSPTLTILPTSTNPTTPNAEVKLASKFRITFNKDIVNDGGTTDNLAPSKAEMEVVGAYFSFKTNPGGVNVAYTVNVITSGLIYEIVPTTALTSETGYQIIWQADPAGTSAKRVKDIKFVPAGNQLSIPLVVNRSYTGVTEDGINPTRDGLVPATTSPLTIINADDDLVISFNEQVQGNNAAGKIQIRYSNGQIFDEINPEDCDFTDAVTFDVVISPNKLFDAHREYYVEIPAGAFTDDSYNKNPYAGFTGNVIWKFKTDDGLAPSVDIYNPLDNESNIPVNANLIMTFSENIQLGVAGKQFVIYFANGDNFPSNDGNAMEIITLPSAQVTVSGSNPADPMHTSDVVTINPAMTFDHNPPGQYYIRIDQGFVKDFASTPNLYAGIHDNTTWNFNITDPTAPTLDAFTPDGSTTVPQTLTGATMTFDRDILARAGGYIRLYQYNYNSLTYAWDTKLVESISVTREDVVINHTTNTVTFNVQTRLDDNTIYYFLIDNGSFTNTSSSHDWYAGLTDPFTWRFTTIQDVTAPVLDGALAVAATNVGATCLDPDAVSFDINFIEANGIQKGTGGLNIFKADGTAVTSVPVSGAVIADNKITFTVPASILADKTEYYVTVDGTAVKDKALAPNYFDSSVIAAGDWTFFTGDFTAPTLDEFTPITGTNNLENDVTVTLTFSENVQPGYEALVITKVSDGTEVYNAILTEDQIAANVATVELAGLEDGETYSVAFGAGLVTDLAYTSNSVECGNLNASVALSTPWEFTIDDNVAPVISGTPLGTNAPAAVTITITADEAVTAVAGKLVTVTAADQTPIEILATDLVTTDNLVFTKALTGLVDNTTYTVTVASGAFIDGAVIANATEAISWEFKTGDNTAPVVDSKTPTTTLPSYIGVELTMTFNEAVVKGTGNITIGALSIPVSSANVTISEDGKTVTIVPTSNLTFQAYTVTVPAGAFKDANNNVSPLTTWSFTIADNAFDASCMSADHFKPFDNSINQEADVNLEITFCEKVVAGTGKVKVFKMVTAGNTLFNDYTVTAAMISADGLKLSIPVTGLEDNTSYGVLIEAGAVKDEAGNNYLGISDPTFWNFTTGDNTAPTLAITSNQTDLTKTTQEVVLTLTFSEPVYGVAAGVTATADGVSVPAQVLTGVDGGKVYTVKVTAADLSNVVVTVAQTITDGVVVLNENALDQVYTFTYTVGDNTAPLLVSAVAPVAPIPTSFNVVLTFNEAVTIPEGAITVSNATSSVLSGTGATRTLSIVAAEEAVVTVTVPTSVTDAAGNHLAAAAVNTFTVGDFTAPTVSASPASGSTNMEATFDVVLTFSPDAIVTNSNITVAEATSYSVNVVGNVATVTITAADMTTVTVTAASTIADEAGNLLAGTKVFTYKTGDNTAPELITVNPNGLATANAHPAKLELFFVENVVVGTGNLTIYRTNGTVELVVPASSVSITNKVVTVNMTASLDKNTQYYVLVDEGFVTDANGNAFVGITSTTYWTFTTGDFATGNNPTVDGSLELKVYPNPFDGFIKVSNASKLSRIVITSITGQKVKEIVSPTEMIQTSELRSGVYLISMYVDDVIAKTERIVKR